MHILNALQSLILLISPVNTAEVDVKPVDFRVQVYPYGGYYSYPPYCPPGYSYGPGFGYRQRGFSFYYGPGYGYPGCYYYGRRQYYGPRFQYRHHRRQFRHHRRHRRR
ncbi:MAG: hypothetical protein K1000chlam3_01344 [Chlamydiae bacterium]|nr:hypothetical protein [Chlamydiota bacterium]